MGSELARSWLVGLLATAADFVVLLLLVEGFGIGARAANVPALVVGALLQFVGTKRFAFRNREATRAAHVVGFTVIEFGALALNAVGFHVLIGLTAIPYVAARVIVTALVYATFSYPLWRRLFRCAPVHRHMACLDDERGS